MKIIVFDVDWVIIKSTSKKKEIIKNILLKYNLYDIPWVKDLLSLWINRKLILDKIYEITPFDKNIVLNEINFEQAIIESNPIKNDNVINFIKDNSEKYLFYTNSALPIDWVNRVINSLNIKKHFQELLAFENWSKVENINYIIKKNNIKPSDILFIEDNLNHINSVKMTGVNTLYFIDYDIDIKKQIEIINSSK